MSSAVGAPETGPERVHSPARAWTAVVMLGLAIFAFVSTELMPIGLLPDIADGVNVSIGQAGFLVTGFAFIVGILATPMTILTGRMNRRLLVAVLLLACTGGNAIAAIAGNYAVLLVGRSIIALAIGVFWSIGAATAVRLVDQRHAVRATSIVVSGLSIASVLGVPLGTLLGNQTSWRVTFIALSGLSLVTLVVALFAIPSLPAVRTGSGLRALRTVFAHPGIRSAVLVTALVMTGSFLGYTYISPFLADVTGVPQSAIAWLLIIYGAAGLVGNFTIAPFLHRSLRSTVVGVVLLLGTSLVVLWFFGSTIAVVIPMLVLWGYAYAALPVVLQTWVFREAAGTGETDAATSLYVSAYNIAIAIGALLGGLLIDALNPETVMIAGAGFVALAVVVALISHRRETRAEA